MSLLLSNNFREECKITWENTGQWGGGEKEKAERERKLPIQKEKNLSGIPLFIVSKIYPLAEEELVWRCPPSFRADF